VPVTSRWRSVQLHPPPYLTRYDLTRRHQGMANEGFADGHVGTMLPTDFPDLLTAPGKAAYGKYVVLTSDSPLVRP
jgi:prepilin-type processing-associated H-X9-DG protein